VTGERRIKTLMWRRVCRGKEPLNEKCFLFRGATGLAAGCWNSGAYTKSAYSASLLQQGVLQLSILCCFLRSIWRHVTPRLSGAEGCSRSSSSTLGWLSVIVDCRGFLVSFRCLSKRNKTRQVVAIVVSCTSSQKIRRGRVVYVKRNYTVYLATGRLS
jgi:hypothetical protein